MSDSDSEAPARPAATEPELPVQPSWTPLYWFLGFVALAFILEEALFEFILEILEFIGDSIFFVVEGSEEHLEDQIEEWFDLDPYHAEIVTAWTLTPVKILAGLLLLRWLWRKARRQWFPKIAAFFRRQYRAVRLAWNLLAWPYKLLAGVVVVGVLAVLI
ncbi:hypothetical protein SAMN02949497_3354 [Methylomagnum ishizawai]|uniref:Uncharacterized protein n=1 Tax=Methylomagnum ishizawai TaxID=1760988 RepID=A0A1Y6D077_9GAMM|nr:hypothetical protein [Methylomagnum ishizawai]SMF95976.1 hypothetical protein SAMN02949497_3354 [Methylomagnum ishizawai]